MRSHDWSGSALGPPEAWPNALRVMCDYMLDSPLPMLILWGQQSLLLYNDAMPALLGERNVASALGLPLDQADAPWRQAVKQLATPSSGAAFTLSKVPISSEVERQADISCVPLRDEQGKPAGICCTFVSAPPTTAARRTMLAGSGALAPDQINEELVRLATDTADIGVWIWNLRSGQVTWENARQWEIFGLPPSAAPLDSTTFLSEFAHPEDVEKFQRAAARMLANGERLYIQGRVRRRDGQERWMEFTGRQLANANGKTELVLGTAADITERKQAERALLDSEARYRTLFDSIDEGFCIIEMMHDQQGLVVDYRFLEANPAFFRQSGLHGAIGKTMKELVPLHDPHWFEIYGRVAATGEALRFQNEAAAMGRWFDVYAMPIGERGSNRVAVLFTDFSERKLSEIKLLQLAEDLARSDRRKTEFLATLAHELRNPLAPICNGIQLMRMAADKPETVAKVRDMMERQLNHMVHLVNDLLDLSRISSDKLELRREQVDLKDVITTAVETSLPQIEARGHVLSLHTSPTPLLVEVDPTRISQVFSNLLNNAAKYTAPRGRISLSVTEQAGQVAVAVADNGGGIPRESLAHVFDMFAQVGSHTNRGGGMGVGLSLVRRLVELHGGSVAAHSDGVGQGSTFTVSLPLLAGHGRALAAPVQARAEPAATGFTPLKVLVVDDNTDAADTLSALLQMDGHQLQVARDGQQALQLAPAMRPDIVFLDIGMPDMDGYQVAQALRALPGLDMLTLVAVTGWGTEDDQEKSRRAGFDHHLTKPASLAAIHTLLSQVARSPNQ